MSSQTSPSRELPMSSPQPSPVAEAPTSGGETNPIRDAISEAIAEHKVILFMKGTPEAPACGFSARTVGALQSLDVPFAAVDVLPDPRIRQELSALSQWPTIPQLFVDGELLGGCDIVTEMYESGELAQALVSRPAPHGPSRERRRQHSLPSPPTRARRGHPPGQPVRGLERTARARARHGRLRRLL